MGKCIVESLNIFLLGKPIKPHKKAYVLHQ